MPYPGPNSQPEVMNSSQPSNVSSSVPDVPNTSRAPTPTPTTPSLSIKLPNAINLSSTPATLKLSGTLINGYPLSGHGEHDYVVIYSGNAAECPRSFIIHVDLTGDNDENEINKQEEKENEEQKEQKGKEDRLYHQQQQQQQQQPISYDVGSRDSHNQRHLQHVCVHATRSVFPWQPSTPSPPDQTPRAPRSPADLPVETPAADAPDEPKSDYRPVELPDSEDTSTTDSSSQPQQTNDADLSYSTSPFSTTIRTPRSVIPTSQVPNPPKPSSPSSRLLEDLNNLPVGLYLCGSALNGYPFSGRGQNDGFCIWSGPAADCPRAFDIRLWLDEEWDEEDWDEDMDYCNFDKSKDDGGGPWYRVRHNYVSDGNRRTRNLFIGSMKPVWPWAPLPSLYTPRGSHSGWTPEPPPPAERRKNGFTMGCWSDYPDGFWGTPPIGAPGGLRADSPEGYRSRPRAWSF